MKKLARLVLVAGLVLALAATLGAQPWKGKGRLRGKVTDPGGKPYEGAKVTLRLAADPGSGPDPVFTNPKGRWSYIGLVGAQWTVRVETAEYAVATAEVEVNELTSGAGKQVEVELQPLAPGAKLADFIDRGNELLQAGSYGEARAAYEQALAAAEGPTRAAVLRGIAHTWVQEQQRAKAIAVLEQSLEIVPDDVDTLKLMVNVYLADGRREKAEPYLARLPEDAKLGASSRLNMGIDQYNDGDLEGAMEQFNRVIADFPDQPESYFYRGLTLLGQQKSADAIPDFEKFLEMDPDSSKAEEAREFLEYLRSE